MTQEQYSSAYNSGFARTVRLLHYRGLAREHAEEIAQAAWAKGWEHRTDLRDPTRVGNWVNTIALNGFRNTFRRPWLFAELPEIPTESKIDASAIDVRRALDKCRARDRELIEGHYFEGYTCEELSHNQHCTAVAVRVRLWRARRKLAATLQQNCETEGAVSTQEHNGEDRLPKERCSVNRTQATDQLAPVGRAA